MAKKEIKKIIKDRIEIYCGKCGSLIFAKYLRRDLLFGSIEEYSCLFCEQSEIINND